MTDANNIQADPVSDARSTPTVIIGWGIAVGFLLFAEAVLWLYYFLRASRGSSSSIHLGHNGDVSRIIEVVGATLLVAAVSVWVIKRISGRTGTLAEALGLAIFSVSVLVYTFATLYYEWGLANWSRSLSHVDALFIALGTLTTAGTGELQASTELAHCLLIVQMLVDILMFTGIVAVVTSRIVSDK